MLNTTELALLSKLAAGPISRCASMLESNLLAAFTKRKTPLAVYVRGFVGKVPVQAHVITEAGRAALGKAGL